VIQIAKAMKYLVRNIQIDRNNIEQSKMFIDELSDKNTGHKGLAMSHRQFMERVDSDDGSQGWKLAQTALSDNVNYQENFDRVYISVGSNRTRLGSVQSSQSNKVNFVSVDSKISTDINQTLDSLIKKQQEREKNQEKITSSIETPTTQDYSPEPIILENLQDIKEYSSAYSDFQNNYPDMQIGSNYNQHNAYYAFRKNLL
jgi:hypothetical protein